MRSDKLSEERIGEILAILDELKASGASAEVFAQSRGVSYGQLRGWLSHAPRWRGQLAGQEVPARASGFVQARLSPQASAGTLANTRAYKKNAQLQKQLGIGIGGATAPGVKTR